MTSPTAAAILDAALARAAGCHWEQVRLADVAADLDCSLADIHHHFPDKEALVDAWWDRADRRMLALAPTTGSREEHVRALVFAWIDNFSSHRETAKQMLQVRLEPGHLHIQLPSLVRLSRTVQWIREAAGMHAPLPWRAIDEAGLTLLFCATVLRWLHDGDREAAQAVLRRGLALRSFFPLPTPRPPDRRT